MPWLSGPPRRVCRGLIGGGCFVCCGGGVGGGTPSFSPQVEKKTRLHAPSPHRRSCDKKAPRLALVKVGGKANCTKKRSPCSAKKIESPRDPGKEEKTAPHSHELLEKKGEFKTCETLTWGFGGTLRDRKMLTTFRSSGQ